MPFDSTKSPGNAPTLSAPPSLPAWLVRLPRPEPVAVPWAACVRSTALLATPLAFGLAADRVAYGLLMAFGALGGVIQDRDKAYQARLLRMLPPQFAAAFGMTVGHLAFGQGWATVAILVVVALASGVIGSIGAVASSCGMSMLFMGVVGAGLPVPGPWWLPGFLVLSGGLSAIAATLLGWPFRNGVPEQLAVAEVYFAAARRLRADDAAAAAAEASVAAEAACDMIVRDRVRPPGRDPAVLQLMGQLDAAHPVLEAAAAVRREGPADPRLVDAVILLGDAVAEGRWSLPEPDFRPRTPAETALHEAIRNAADHLGPPLDDAPDEPAKAPEDFGCTAAFWHPRAFVQQAAHTMSGALSWTHGARVALCVGIAYALVQVAGIPQSFWVAMAVALVLMPDLGPVFARGVHRALGALVGVLMYAAVSVPGPQGWPEVVALAVLGFVLPIARQVGYGMQTAAVTLVMLILTEQLSPTGAAGLIPEPVADTLIGCGIVLVFGYAVWPGSRQDRLRTLLGAAVQADAAYVRALAHRGGTAGQQRAQARIRADRMMRDARIAFRQALAEPPPRSREAARAWPLLVSVERMTLGVSAASARLDDRSRRSQRKGITSCADDLEALGAAIRDGRAVVPPPARSGEPGAMRELASEARDAAELHNAVLGSADSASRTVVNSRELS